MIIVYSNIRRKRNGDKSRTNNNNETTIGNNEMNLEENAVDDMDSDPKKWAEEATSGESLDYEDINLYSLIKDVAPKPLTENDMSYLPLHNGKFHKDNYPINLYHSNQNVFSEIRHILGKISADIHCVVIEISI